MRKKILEIAFILALGLSASALPLSAYAGIPVIDGANLAQSILTVIETISQTLKQIEQYRTQLDQYENQLQNTAVPSVYIWDRAQNTINGLLGAIDTLAHYKRQVGSIDEYLSKTNDLGYYRNSPCVTGECTDYEKAKMAENRAVVSESQKKANDAVFRGMDRQQEALKADARTLERLQSSAQGASGQMQALQYANQFASAQSNQLLQIRGLLIAQQNTIATRNQALADREAQEEANSEKLRKEKFKPSSGKAWW